MEKKLDVRIIKTKATIKKVFFELMDEIGFSKITVKKIIERAEINRSTFYAHYADKYDLLNKIEEDLIQDLTDVLKKDPCDPLPIEERNRDFLMEKLYHIAYYLKEHGKEYMLLTSEKGDPSMLTKFSSYARQLWDTHNANQRLTIPENYAIAAFMGLIGNMTAVWIAGGFQESPKEFVNIVVQVIWNIPENIIK